MAEILSIIVFPISAYHTVEKFYEFGKFAYELTQTYKHTPDEIEKVRVFLKDMYDGELKRNMERTQWVFDQEDAPKLMKSKFSDSLKVLKEQLQSTQHTLDSCFDKKGNYSKTKYAIHYKKRITTALAALEDWNLSFWRELHNLVTIRSLPEPLLLGKTFALPSHRCEPIAGLLKLGHAEVRENSQIQQVSVIVEQVQKLKEDGLPDGNFRSNQEREEALDDAKVIALELAQTLQFSAKGILRCLGYRNSPEIELVFQVPDGHKAAYTLRQLLSDWRSGRNKDILAPWDLRFRLSRELVLAVYSTNAAGYVHKNLSPDNVVVFSREATRQVADVRPFDLNVPYEDDIAFEDLGSAYLMGWRMLRKHDAVTRYSTDEFWTKDFYRHSRRQGLHPQDRYETKHDVYSLGVCLLEVGLWQTFIVEKNGIPTISDFFLSAAIEHAGPLADELIDIDASNMSGICGSGNLVKIFTAIARARLPMHMGTPFAELVVKCLTNVDGGFGNPNTFAGSEAASIFQQLIINDSPIAGFGAADL